MADAATTNRGLNALLAAASLSNVEGGDRILKLPAGANGQVPAASCISTKALFKNSSRSATTKKLVEADRTETISLAGDSWVSIDWDPEVAFFELTPIDATGTDGIEVSTVPGGAANAGMEIPDGVTKTFYVADDPTGRIYIRRTNAGNSGNGSNTVKVNHLAYGSRGMLNASSGNAGTAHS